MDDTTKFEISMRYRFLDEDGRPTALRFRFFQTARAAHDFLNRLDAIDSRQTINVTIARREIGPWCVLDRLALQAAAASEGGRP